MTVTDPGLWQASGTTHRALSRCAKRDIYPRLRRCLRRTRLDNHPRLPDSGIGKKAPMLVLTYEKLCQVARQYLTGTPINLWSQC